MNAHLALHARVYDYEEGERNSESNLKYEVGKQASLNTATEAAKLAEVEAVEEKMRQHSDERDYNAKTVSKEDVMAVFCSGDKATVVTTDEGSKKMATATTAQDVKAHKDNERKEGGHASGEAWTESPHFLWGP